MNEIESFFNNLNKDIKEARTLRTLKLLRKRARKFVESFDKPVISRSIKSKVRKEYIKSLKLIQQKQKLF